MPWWGWPAVIVIILSGIALFGWVCVVADRKPLLTPDKIAGLVRPRTALRR